jgi:PIN domain nuclease of toxin-antitoxin system
VSLNLLLDTHILIWATTSPDRLDENLREAVLAHENQVFISSVTLWEIAIKKAAGRLKFPIEQYESIARRMGAAILPILPNHAIAAGALPRHHDDPFDRMLIAQATVENLVLATTDRQIARYGVRIF